MFAVTVLFEVASDEFERFVQRVRQQANDSLQAEPACHRFDVCESTPTPGRLLLYELYDDRAAFDYHLTTEHFLDFDAAVKDWVIEKHVETWVIEE